MYIYIVECTFILANWLSLTNLLLCQRFTENYCHFFFILTNRFKDGDIIETPDAENETLILHDLSETDSGLYRCRVHNDAGCVYSDEANLTVTGRLSQWYFYAMDRLLCTLGNRV